MSKKILIVLLVIGAGVALYMFVLKPKTEEITNQDTTTQESSPVTTNTSTTFGEPVATSPEKSATGDTQETTRNQAPSPVQKSDASASSNSITTAEKESMITAFFAFGKLLNGASSDPVTAYIKKSHPQDSAQLLASMNLNEDFSEIAPMIRAFGGYEDLTPSDFRAPTTVWKKQGNVVTVDVETKGASMGYKAQFINQGGVWYVDMNK